MPVLAFVRAPRVNGATSKKAFYGTNPHGDIKALTDSTDSRLFAVE